MRDRDRVLVHVQHTGTRVLPLRDLVHVADGRDAGADVQELVDALVGEEPDRAAEKSAVEPGDLAGAGHQLFHPDREIPVRREVVPAAQQEVISPGHTGYGHVDTRGHPLVHPGAWLVAHGPYLRFAGQRESVASSPVLRGLPDRVLACSVVTPYGRWPLADREEQDSRARHRVAR
ncbi:hypothetical protein GCM10029964_029380 [Kibdelosporangium lantanae]